MPIRTTTRVLAFQLAFGFCSVLPRAQAENRIMATHGDTPSMCEEPARVLREYTIATRHWSDLRNQGADEIEIQDAKNAIDSAVMSLDPERAGVIVFVEKKGPQTFTPNVPKIEINGRVNELAQIVAVGIEPNSTRYNLTQEKTQMRVDFKLLGICSFVSPGSPLTRRILQRAVDTLLGK